jgi:hypothetical protein
MHEPAAGAYLGGWLSPEFSHISVRSFGNMAEKPHAIFVCDMELGDDIPLSWLLHVMAAEAVPLFYLRPCASSLENPFPLHAVIDLARGLGAYNSPMFLAFFPLEQGHGMNAEDYVSDFRLARIFFRVYAPQVAFVWVAPEGRANTSPASPFYPGHDAVDWVALPALALRAHDGYNADILAALTPFHQAFQRHKPIMLLPLGISHFSRVDYTYNIRAAAAEIGRVYAGLSGFPRVKAVVYRDARNFGPQRDDMTLTRESELMLAYAQAVSCGHFLPAVQPLPLQFRQWLRSAFHGYLYDGNFYADCETLTSELSVSLPGATFEINNRPYVNIDLLPLDITVDRERRIIYINLPS